MDQAYSSSDDEGPRFSDGFDLVSQALADFLPPERVSVDDYAAQNRWLDNRPGGYVGRWSHDEAPYLVEPMATLTSREYLTAVIVGPGRSGKTAVGQNWMLQSVGADPADMLVYLQTDEALQSYVKREINPMIDTHDILSSRLGTLPVDRSLHFKRFRGMWVEFLAATYSNLINKSAPRLVLTEIDAYAQGLGDVLELASLRRQTFGRESMMLAESHPDLAEGMDPKLWRRGIMKAYRDSTRCTWWWPCPDCNAFSSANPIASRVMTLHFDEDAPLDEIEGSARLLCPSCGSLIEDKWRRSMNSDGRWIGLGQAIGDDGTMTGERVTRDTAGWWITGLMSPFIIGGIGKLAADWVRERRDAEQTRDDKSLKSFVVKRLGWPYEPPRSIKTVDAATLAERAEVGLDLGVVPDNVRFITTSIDVQPNRFEVLTRGWGEHGESWVIDYEVVPAETSTSGRDWDSVLTRAISRRYPLRASPERAMAVRGVAFDTGGAPGATQQAYDAWRRARARRDARFLGEMSGRHVYTIIPTKGLGGTAISRLQVVYPDHNRKDRMVRASGNVPQAQFAVDWFKDALAGQLAVGEPGAWFVHVPAALRRNEDEFFSQLTAERRNERGRWEKTGRRNEVLDLMVLGHVVAHLHGLSRIDWAKPPTWASAHDTNSLIRDRDEAPVAAADLTVATPPLPTARPSTPTVPTAASGRGNRFNAFA